MTQMATTDKKSQTNDAAQYNQRVLRKLQKAVARQPDLDLLSAIPSQYQSKLAAKKQCYAQDQEDASAEFEADHGTSSPPRTPLCYINDTRPASILYPLSDTVQSMLNSEEPEWANSGLLLSHAVSRVLRSATVLFQSTSDSDHFVARCGEDVVLKAISQADSTEYTTLQFLEKRMPTVLAPKPHGVLAVDKVWYMFMSYIPGVSLDTIWSSLSESQKHSVSCDLNKILLELREIPFQRGNMLGGVAGQGCKDTRRHKRTASTPIYTVEGLWEFMYGCARNKETIYGKFLRKLTFPPRKQSILFIHGDLRPANVIVRSLKDGRIQVTGLIDWEMSGFYPEDLECVKALNNLSPIGKDDWFLHLPECISPRNHLESWHADWVWDSYVV